MKEFVSQTISSHEQWSFLRHKEVTDLYENARNKTSNLSLTKNSFDKWKRHSMLLSTTLVGFPRVGNSSLIRVSTNDQQKN